LGINGAGKTTTLQMLTADQIPSGGGAYLAGMDINTEQNQIRKVLGYCPQFDALIGTLTARETLFLYARIKGMPEVEIGEYVSRMLTKLTLDEYADKPCGGYSGGNKRKLSVGMALIGNPKIVFLDEPSTGMDPKSRRFMWELISSTMKGRSVILTTHSMEEAEAICGRIGIMVGGRLRCLGSAQHLKQRYGNGYQLDCNLNDEKNVVGLQLFLTEHFPSHKLLEQHGSSLKYQIPKDGKVSLGKMFKLFEDSKSALGIQEYSLSETSLEQIFIHFAQQQKEETGSVAGLEREPSRAAAPATVACPQGHLVGIPPGLKPGTILACPVCQAHVQT
jgi:ABC-type multidrug transport system ATPase subunit